MSENKPDLAKLDRDGAVLDIGDGRALRLKVRPDDTNPFDGDQEFYGRIASVDSVPVNDYGHRERPEDFTGNAEKLWIGRSDQVWWEPPAEGPKRGTPEFEEWRAHVRQLGELGYVGVVLELLEGADGYGKPIVRKVASLWGIDSLEDGYLSEVVSELWAEMA